MAYRLQSITERKQGKSLETGTEAGTMEEHYLLACTIPLIMHPRVTSTGGTTHSTLNHLTSIINQENASQAHQQDNLIEEIVIVSLASQVTLIKVKLVKGNQPKHVDISEGDFLKSVFCLPGLLSPVPSRAIEFCSN